MGKKPDSEVTNVHAENYSVAAAGGIHAPVTINDLDTVAEAVRTVMLEMGRNGITTSQVDIEQVLQGEFDQLIDEYRRKIEVGKVSTALDLFNDLFSRQREKLSPTQVFRIKANIAICHVNLGDSSLAAHLLHEACTFAPDEPKAIANKVLAYILEEKISEAYSQAVESLGQHPDNEWLAANALQAARLCKDESDVYSLISDRAKDTECVCAAHIDYLASRKSDRLLETANNYLERFPENSSIRNAFALTEIEPIANEHNDSQVGKFPIANPAALDKAVSILEEGWNKFEGGERVIHPADEADANNLIICYALRADIKKLRAFCLNFVQKYPESRKIIEIIVQISLDFRLDDVFQKAIPLLTDEFVQRRYKFVKLLHERNWKELAKYQDYTIEKFEPEFRSAVKVATFIAQAKLGSAKGKAGLEKLLAEEILSSRARYTLYELAAAADIRPIVQIAYDYGLSAVTEESDHSEIIAYCRIAQSLHDWRRIIELLRNIADPTENCEETRLLALAYVNDYPIRESAVKFFETLIDANKETNHFKLLAGIFSYKRKDFGLAKDYLNAYLKEGGRDAFGFLSLTDIARLEGDDEELKRLLTDYDARDIVGTPEQTIHIARLLTLHGDAKEGLALGYDVYSENPKNAEVALGYTHIFLFSGKRIEIESIDTISPGVWFSLTSSEGLNLERTVDEKYDDAFQLDPESLDEYTRKVYGYKVGESFTQNKLQGEITWTVSEIKHKYLRAFHYILANYELDFPSAGGLWAMKMKGDDIQPILDFIKRSSEQDKNVITELCSKRIPLSAMGKIWQKNIIKITDMVRAHNGEIFTCIGELDERKRAYAAINETAKNGIVLDTYTAWVASGSNILEFIEKAFGKIIVGRSSIVELLHFCEEAKGQMGSGLSLGWLNGEFHKTVTSIEERDAFIAEIQRRVKTLEQRCTIESYDFPESINQVTDEIIEQLGSEILEPYFIAMKHQALFCSEDFFSRDFAKGLFQLNSSSWLQPLLDIAKNSNLITQKEYCSCIVYLALHSHSHIYLVPAMLEQIYQDDSSLGLFQFSAVAKYIGVENAEIESHYNVVKAFLAMRWGEDVTPVGNPSTFDFLRRSISPEHPDVKAMKATSILLANIIRVPDGLMLLTHIANLPALRLGNYVQGWFHGHFFPSET